MIKLIWRFALLTAIAAGFAWEYPPDNLDDFFRFVEENYYLEATLGERAVYRLGEQ